MEQTKQPDDKPGRPDPKPPKPDEKLRLTLRTASGSDEENFKSDDVAAEILERAIKRFKMKPEDPNRPYEMRRESDSKVLDRGATLANLGLADGDVIIIQPTQAVDG